MILLLASLTLAQDEPPPPVRIGTAPTRKTLERDPEGFGLGLILGLPTGLSFAFRPDGPLYFDAALAWSFAGTGGYAIHFDVLYTVANLRNDDEIPDVVFPVYVGVGPRTRIGTVAGSATTDPVALGVRIPLGMSFHHDSVPIEGFVELVPGLSFFPAARFYFEAAIGGRFYFGRKGSA